MSGTQIQHDFRVHVGFFSHRKTLRLERELGAEGVLALLRLWAYAAANHPDGDLGDADDHDIAAIAGWRGDDSSAFVSALETCEFLDVLYPSSDSDPDRIRSGSEAESGSDPTRIRSGVRLHDWATHQPYIAHREARQEASKRANQARWNRRKSLSRKGSSASDPDRIRTGGKAESPSSSPSPIRGRDAADAAAGPMGPPPRVAATESDAPAPISFAPPIANAIRGPLRRSVR